MKIKIKSEIKEAKSFNYILHTLQVTEANILNWMRLNKLFQSPDYDTGEWEKFIRDYDSGINFVNIKENSFDIEIIDYYNNLINEIKEFLTINNIKYEEC